MRKTITGQGLEEKGRAIIGVRVAGLGETAEEEKCEGLARVMTPDDF